MKLKLFSTLIGLAGFALFLASCSSTQEVIMQGAGETFHRGMELLQKEDYADAQNTFNIVVKQYPASAYADSAQFYLAESYFDMKEYITAAFEFGNVFRNYPSSMLTPDARFKIAECYAAQSPRVQLDQDNTTKAINAFQSFIDYYPNSSLASKAAQEIMKLRNKLALKDYEIAQLYMNMGYYKAATVYYDVILDQYHDSDVADKAALGKVKVLLKRHKDKEARAELEKFYAMFPNSTVKIEADELAHTLNLSKEKQAEVN